MNTPQETPEIALSDEAKVRDFLSTNLRVTESIETFEDDVMHMDQLEIPAKERLIAGMYVREITIPKDTLITGRVWKHGYVDIMVSGDISIATPDGLKRVTGWNVLEGKPGRKRAGVTHQDTHWITVHRTDIEEMDSALESLAFIKMAEYEAHRAKEDTESFRALLDVMGLTETGIQAQVQNTADMTILPDVFDDLVTIAPSKIHGTGLFAKMPFERGEHIAPARLNGFRTIAGRYSNHSALPNAKMELNEFGDVDLIAIRSISAGEEITTHYQHTIQTIQGESLCQQ